MYVQIFRKFRLVMRKVLRLQFFFALFLFVTSSQAQYDLERLKQQRLQMLSDEKDTPFSIPNLQMDYDIPTGSEEKLPSTLYGSVEQILADKVLDSSSYILGANDEFTIYVIGPTNQTYTVAVNNEGQVIIPKIGSVVVRGLSLAEGKALIKEKVRSVYKNVEVNVVLTRVRLFKVHITGNLAKQGSFKVTGLTRVSELITMAGGLEPDSRYRGIEIRNEHYPDRIADLALFYHSCSFEKNPYLLEGDQVYLAPRKEIFRVEGFVSYPGTYDYLEGDNLKTILEMVGGFSRGADSSNITVTRFLDDKDSLKTFKLGVGDSLFQIFPDDRIYVFSIPEYRVFEEVTVQGEVNYPGIYPIKEGETVKEVILRAGGFTKDASLSASKLIRYEGVRQDDKELERLRHIPGEVELSPSEATYIKSGMLEEKGLFTISFADLFESETDDILLRDGDLVVIEKMTNTVRVSGAVMNPGLVEFSPDADYRFYIEEAGGKTKRAKRNDVRIIKAGQWYSKRVEEVNSIEPGDMILVSETIYRDPMTDVKDVLVILSSLATILTGFITIGDYFRK